MIPNQNSQLKMNDFKIFTSSQLKQLNDKQLGKLIPSHLTGVDVNKISIMTNQQLLAIPKQTLQFCINATKKNMNHYMTDIFHNNKMIAQNISRDEKGFNLSEYSKIVTESAIKHIKKAKISLEKNMVLIQRLFAVDAYKTNNLSFDEVMDEITKRRVELQIQKSLYNTYQELHNVVKRYFDQEIKHTDQILKNPFAYKERECDAQWKQNYTHACNHIFSQNEERLHNIKQQIDNLQAMLPRVEEPIDTVEEKERMTKNLPNQSSKKTPRNNVKNEKIKSKSSISSQRNVMFPKINPSVNAGKSFNTKNVFRSNFSQRNKTIAEILLEMNSNKQRKLSGGNSSLPFI